MQLAHDINKGYRTNDVKIAENITFQTMFLAPNTLKGLTDSGFHKPSPIQLYGIPIGKCGIDLLLEAKSGTGKTAVFTVIALETIDFCKGLQVVILTPTREIAAQICDVIKQIGSSYKELQIATVIGGLPVQDDIKKFKMPVHIVVGSPGRLKHLIENKQIDTKAVRLLVLDEADKLMDNSFQPDIKFIHSALPKQKQVIMSSATYPKSSRDLISSYVEKASHICPDSDCVLLGINQKVAVVKYNTNIIRHTENKFRELKKILGRWQFKQCLVFCNYQARVDDVHELLLKQEWPSEKLHGGQVQVDRLDALKILQQYKCRVLVSTDLAARGIDASNVDLVVNFEAPYDWQTYLHRIGRAGRFGSYGLAITILSDGKEQERFKEIIKSIDISLKMRHLWSDAEFIVNIPSETPSELCKLPIDNPENEDAFEEIRSKSMWKLLSSTKDSVDSTETHLKCKLEENSEHNKIESFSELVLSLEESDYQNSFDDFIFKHIEINKTSLNKIMSEFKNTLENDLIVKKQAIRPGKHNYNSKRSEKFNRTSFDTPKSDNDHLKNVITHKNKTIGNNDSNRTLLKLDLPTEFSNPKSKFSNSKQNITYYDNERLSCKSHVENNSISEINYNQPQLKKNIESDINDVTDQFNTSIERNPLQRHETELHKHSKETYNLYEKEHSCKNKTQPNHKRCIRNYSKPNPIKQKSREESYNDWYNQLKVRMKQIEQAIYINEMSKF